MEVLTKGLVPFALKMHSYLWHTITLALSNYECGFRNSIKVPVAVLSVQLPATLSLL